MPCMKEEDPRVACSLNFPMKDSGIRDRLCDELDDTTGLLDLLLGLLADVAGADDEGNVGETAL